MKKKLAILGLMAALLFIALVVGRRFLGNGEASVQEYKMAKIKLGDIRSVVSSSGTVNPLNNVSVGSQVSGIIQKINVDFNSEVTADQVIALIDDSVYSAQVDQAKAKLLMAEMQLLERERDIIASHAGIQSAMASLNSARASFQLAEIQFDRSKSLFRREIISKAELDAGVANLDNARGNVEVAEARVQTNKAQLQRVIAQKKGAEANIADKSAALGMAEVRLKYCTIVSPINGIVIQRNVDVGQTVATSLQSPTLFSIAEDLSRMQLEVDVSESDVGQIKQNQDVEFTVDAFPDRKFKAIVQQIRNTPTNIQNVVTYKIIASVDNGALLLRPGMTANVSIEVARVDNVLKVPNSALRFRPPKAEQQEKHRKPDVKDNSFYIRTVEGLGLDANQAQALEKIIEKAGAKLRQALKTAESSQEKRAAFRSFYTTVVTQLRPLLTEEQETKLGEFLRKMREKRHQRKISGAKAAKIYVLNEKGKPEQVRGALSGISNEIETQIISDKLRQGDNVVTGIMFRPGAATSKSTNNPFMPKGRRR